MPLFLGEKEVDKVYIGEKEIRQIYLGEKEIWGNSKIVNLGSGTEWDIKKYTSKYKDLTVDNFYYLSMEDVSASNSITVPGDESYLSIWGWLAKKYDSDTGTFTSNHFLEGSSKKVVKVTPVLVVDPSKLIDLGSDQTFNIKEKFPTKYDKYTENNFIIARNKTGRADLPDNPYSYVFNHFRGEAGTWSVTCTHKLEKKYDKETGILTCRIRSKATANVASDSFDNTFETHVYLVEKAL